MASVSAKVAAMRVFRDVPRSLDVTADVHLSMKAASASSAAVLLKLDCAAMMAVSPGTRGTLESVERPTQRIEPVPIKARV